MLRYLLFLITALALAACGASDAPSQTGVTDPASYFKVEDAWVHAPLVGRDVTAGYMTISTADDKPASLVSVSSPQAGRSELHTHIMDGETMRMRKVEGIEIPGDGAAELKPMGDHIMFFGVDDLTDGDTVALELTLQVGDETSTFTVDAPVRTLGN